MNAPVTSERKSFLPLRLRSTTIVGSGSNIPIGSHHPTTPATKSMSLNVQNDTDKSLSLTLGSRVLFNDVKIGTLRYIGTVEFAQGLFCGIELDEPEGKHDGQVNDIRYFQCKPDHGIFVPKEKVTLALRQRANTIQRSIGPIKSPVIKRTMTMSSSTNNINNEQPSIKPPTIKRTMTMSSSSASPLNNNNEQTSLKPSILKRTMTMSSTSINNNNNNEQIPVKSPILKRTMTMSSTALINNNNNSEQTSVKPSIIKRTMTMSSSTTSIDDNNEQIPIKSPISKRTMTVSSSNKTEQIPIKSSPKKQTHLPDIIPNSSVLTQPVLIIKPINKPIITDHDEIITPTNTLQSIVPIPSSTIDEISETIVPDFTDSVSVFLQHFQQDDQSSLNQYRPSLTISEEGTIDDDDDIDDDEESDIESIAESMLSEKSSINNSTKSTQTDLSFDMNENVQNLLRSSSLSTSSTSINEFKINPVQYRNREKPNLPTSPVTKIFPVRKLSTTLDKPSIPSRKTSLPIVNNSRKPSLTSPKTIVPTLVKPKSPSGIQSKFNRSLSSSTSIASSQSDLTTSPRKFSEASQLDKKSNLFDPQSTIQKALIQSLEATNESLKKQYQHAVNQFDLMYILNQYYANQNEKMRQEYERNFSKFRIKTSQLKISIEELKSLHENELEKLNEQHKNTINTLQQTHQQDITKYQQELKQSLNEKVEIETRCTTLQKEVDRFMYEMENSEYADPLLRRVEILEKDRGSLETALEIRTQELTQLRAQANEQVLIREDQLALQKRLDMAENRNQDLVFLLRNWQLNELSIGVQCEQLKEKLAQIERDNRQLIFENETLLYTLRQRSPTISDNSLSTITSRSKLPRPTRAQSFSNLIPSIETNSMKHSSSLDSIENR